MLTILGASFRRCFLGNQTESRHRRTATRSSLPTPLPFLRRESKHATSAGDGRRQFEGRRCVRLREVRTPHRAAAEVRSAQPSLKRQRGIGRSTTRNWRANVDVTVYTQICRNWAQRSIRYPLRHGGLMSLCRGLRVRNHSTPLPATLDCLATLDLAGTESDSHARQNSSGHAQKASGLL